MTTGAHLCCFAKCPNSRSVLILFASRRPRPFKYTCTVQCAGSSAHCVDAFQKAETGIAKAARGASVALQPGLGIEMPRCRDAERPPTSIYRRTRLLWKRSEVSCGGARGARLHTPACGRDRTRPRSGCSIHLFRAASGLMCSIMYSYVRVM